MKTDDDGLVLLTECANVDEASAIRSLLQSHEIRVLVQGENHASMLGVGQVLISPRVMVPRSQIEKAKELANAFIVLDGAKGQPENIADGVCAVHEKQAIATCGRCGNFLCTECKTLGEPPVCEECMSVEGARVSRRAGQGSKNLVLFGIAVGFLLMLVPLLRTLIEMLQRP